MCVRVCCDLKRYPSVIFLTVCPHCKLLAPDFHTIISLTFPFCPYSLASLFRKRWSCPRLCYPREEVLARPRLSLLRVSPITADWLSNVLCSDLQLSDSHGAIPRQVTTSASARAALRIHILISDSVGWRCKLEGPNHPHFIELCWWSDEQSRTVAANKGSTNCFLKKEQLVASGDFAAM